MTHVMTERRQICVPVLQWFMCNSLVRYQYMAIFLHMSKEPTKEKQVLDLTRKAKILRVLELAE